MSNPITVSSCNFFKSYINLISLNLFINIYHHPANVRTGPPFGGYTLLSRDLSQIIESFLSEIDFQS